MNDQELRALVERMITELADGKILRSAQNDKSGLCHSEARRGEESYLPDITEIDLRRQYLVDHPENGPGYLALKAKTPARIGVGRAGARYKTITMLRVRADHAAAQDSCFSMVSDEFVTRNGFTQVQTLCTDKDEYLTRPDKGRRFDAENQAILKKALGQSPKVALVVGDGLSATAIEANVQECIPAIQSGLKALGISPSPVLFVKYCRVGASDHIGDLTGAEVVCLLVGERPGLVTAESMSAYITYKPHVGIPESKRTVISNIHRQGTTAVAAGAQIATLVKTMLDKKASGIDLR